MGLPLLALLLAEGASSAILFGRDVVREAQAPSAAKRTVSYDSLLGWQNRPGALMTENVPVPRLVSRFPEVRFLLRAAQWSRMSQLFRRIGAKVGTGRAAAPHDSALALVVSAIVGELSAMSRTDGSIFVLLYLPTLDDYLHPPDLWRERLRAASKRQSNVVYLDLVTELRRLPPDSAVSMFIPIPSTDADAEGRGHGHYTAAGNQWVADHLFRRPLGVPAIAARMAR